MSNNNPRAVILMRDGNSFVTEESFSIIFNELVPHKEKRHWLPFTSKGQRRIVPTKEIYTVVEKMQEDKMI